MSTYTKYNTYCEKYQIYFVFRVQLAALISQAHTVFDVVVNEV